MKTTKLSIYLSTLVFVLTPFAVRAQLVNCNAFMQGNYIEAGVNWNGCFGSSTTPPSGYHPEATSSYYNAPACGGTVTTGNAIGFIADPARDGWDAGSPARYGDYILHGLMQEGWSYMADGVEIDAWNKLATVSDSLTDGMVSSVVSYTDTLGVKTIKTQAIKDGIYITQFYSLEPNSLYINVDVIIENTSLATAANIFYMRTINPHNDETYSSVATTKNKIDYALPDTLNRSVVSTRGTVYGDAYLSLATQDYRAKAFIYKNTGATTIDNIYSGDTNYFTNKNDSNVDNTSIGLIYDLGNMNSGGQAHFNFIYAFHPSVIDSTLNVVDTDLAVNNISTQQFKVYPNPVAHSFKVLGLQQGDGLTLYDMLGRAVATYAYSSNYFNMDGLLPGNYMLVIRNKQGTVTGRLPLQKE